MVDSRQEHKQSKSDIEHPCIRNCCLDSNDVCIGCFRTLDEILRWSSASATEKKAILTLCQHRRNPTL
ncbi:DUF1289 domain-containing protein [Pseudoalteromonas sp. SSDWG2]|uniref:DUF1289 domain-containing protein n=1 Tax=Pseudoalteromonas sp. SSDWG2 TaxID=3139391 RepID=UPI003BA9CB8D